MNELLIGLVAVGALALGGLAIYNRIEERRFKRQLEDESRAADPLMDDAPDFETRTPVFTAYTGERREPVLDEATNPAPVSVPEVQNPEPREPASGRIEPVLEPVSDPVDDVPAPPAPRMAAPDIPGPCDELLDFCLRIDGHGVHGSVFNDAVTRCRAFHRPVRWWGLPVDGRTWQELQPWRDVRFEHVLVTVQLADRNGATSADDLTAVSTLVEPHARANQLGYSVGDIAEAAARAAALDAFCVEVDLLIGLNIIAADGGEFAQGPLVREAVAAGLVPANDGSYLYHAERGEAQFQLVNHEAEAFQSGKTTLGATLQFDVPRVAEGLAAFDRMVALGQTLAAAVGGRLVDDSMRPLSDAGIARIRAQLTALYQRMDAHGVPAGSPRALRLFA